MMVWVIAAVVRNNNGNKYSGVPMGRPWNLGARSRPAFPPGLQSREVPPAEIPSQSGRFLPEQASGKNRVALYSPSD